MTRLLALLLLLPALTLAQGLPIKGGASTDLAGVNANKQLEVHQPGSSTQAGYGKIAGKDGSPMKVTAMGYPEISIDSMEFMDTVDGAAVNTNLWNQSTSTMTITQATGLINLNPTNSVAINTYAILSSVQSFYLTDCVPLHAHLRVQSSLWNLPANTVMEFGWMSAATNAAPTDGMLIRARAGVVYAVMNYGGSETELPITPTLTMPAVNATQEWVLDFYANELRVYVDGALVSTATTSETLPTTQVAPTVNPAATTANRQPITFRVYNTGSAPGSSPTLKIGQISVQQRNANFGKPYADKLIGMGRGGYQNPLTTFAQTTNHTNSTSPTSATLSNTAAGYTTLGGRFQFAAPAGAVTDFALFGFQVPAGYQLYVTGIYIDAVNTGAAVATTATVLDWSVGINSSAVSLATADGTGTWAPRRIPLGVQSWIVSAGIGAPVEAIKRPLSAPLVVDGGRFLHIIVQVPIGTATASQVIRGDVLINGYFE